MRLGQARFVTGCQQLLALGAVLAVLTPAASVISLDVVHQAPTQAAAPALREVSARVPTAAVDPVVREYPLTAPLGHKSVAGPLRPGSRRGRARAPSSCSAGPSR